MRRGLLVLALSLVLAIPCQAAVTVVDTPTEASSFASATFSWSHTASGTGLVVVLMTSGNTACTSVTFDSVAMTELWDLGDSGAIGSCGYLMVSPNAGAHTVAVTIAGAVDAWGGAVGLAGIETASVAAAHRTVYTGTGGGGGAPTVTVVDSQSGDVVINGVGVSDTAITAAQTLQIQEDNLFGNAISGGLSTTTAAGASTVMNWTTTGTFWASGATALIASAGGAAAVARALLVGVGP